MGKPSGPIPAALNIRSICILLASSKLHRSLSMILLNSVNVRSSNPALWSPAKFADRSKLDVENPVEREEGEGEF